jgi:hypothetical protein
MFQLDWEKHETSSDVQVITYFFDLFKRVAWHECLLSTLVIHAYEYNHSQLLFSPPFSTNEEKCNVSFGTALFILLFEHLMMLFSYSKLAISNLSSTIPPGPSSSAAVDASEKQDAVKVQRSGA